MKNLTKKCRIYAACEDFSFVQLSNAREYLYSLLSRVIHQASRNGADRVFVADRQGRLAVGQSYGRYVLETAEGPDNAPWRLVARDTFSSAGNP